MKKTTPTPTKAKAVKQTTPAKRKTAVKAEKTYQLNPDFIAQEVDAEVTKAVEVLHLDYMLKRIKQAGGTLLIKHGVVYEHINELEMRVGGGLFDISKSRKPWYKVSVNQLCLNIHNSGV